MSAHTQMFKFTQLRPVNGIDYYKVESKHFPLYDGLDSTALLQKIEQEGLPLGIKHALSHLGSDSFKHKVDAFKSRAASHDTESRDIYTLVSVLQKVINHTEEYPLIEGKQDDLEILQYSRGMLKRYDFDNSKIAGLISNISIGDISDDLYSLLLASSFHTEYRRYVDTLYRFIFLTETYGPEKIFGIFSSENTTLDDADYSILKRFLNGRILLPNSVKTNKKPLPKLKDSSNAGHVDTTSLSLSAEAVKGVSLAVMYQSRAMKKANAEEPKKKPKKRNTTKKLKANSTKISLKKEAKK